MDIVITPTQIESTNFRSATEIWLARPDAVGGVDSSDPGSCLWRGRPVVSHDMLSEGTHDQNVRRVWLVIPHVDDLAALQARLAARLAVQDMEGEFHPAEHGQA